MRTRHYAWHLMHAVPIRDRTATPVLFHASAAGLQRSLPPESTRQQPKGVARITVAAHRGDRVSCLQRGPEWEVERQRRVILDYGFRRAQPPASATHELVDPAWKVVGRTAMPVAEQLQACGARLGVAGHQMVAARPAEKQLIGQPFAQRQLREEVVGHRLALRCGPLCRDIKDNSDIPQILTNKIRIEIGLEGDIDKQIF